MPRQSKFTKGSFLLETTISLAILTIILVAILPTIYKRTQVSKSNKLRIHAIAAAESILDNMRRVSKIKTPDTEDPFEQPHETYERLLMETELDTNDSSHQFVDQDDYEFTYYDDKIDTQKTIKLNRRIDIYYKPEKYAEVTLTLKDTHVPSRMGKPITYNASFLDPIVEDTRDSTEYGYIIGNITDFDTGAPVPHAYIYVYREPWRTFVCREGWINEGTYRIGPLSTEHQYKLKFLGRDSVWDQYSYWEKYTPEFIQLSGGYSAVTENMVLRRRYKGKIETTVKELATETPIENVLVKLMQWPWRSGYTDSNGAVSLTRCYMTYNPDTAEIDGWTFNNGIRLTENNYYTKYMKPTVIQKGVDGDGELEFVAHHDVSLTRKVYSWFEILAKNDTQEDQPLLNNATVLIYGNSNRITDYSTDPSNMVYRYLMPEGAESVPTFSKPVTVRRDGFATKTTTFSEDFIIHPQNNPRQFTVYLKESNFSLEGNIVNFQGQITQNGYYILMRNFTYQVDIRAVYNDGVRRVVSTPIENTVISNSGIFSINSPTIYEGTDPRYQWTLYTGDTSGNATLGFDTDYTIGGITYEIDPEYTMSFRILSGEELGEEGCTLTVSIDGATNLTATNISLDGYDYTATVTFTNLQAGQTLNVTNDSSIDWAIDVIQSSNWDSNNIITSPVPIINPCNPLHITVNNNMDIMESTFIELRFTVSASYMLDSIEYTDSAIKILRIYPLAAGRLVLQSITDSPSTLAPTDSFSVTAAVIYHYTSGLGTDFVVSPSDQWLWLLEPNNGVCVLGSNVSGNTVTYTAQQPGIQELKLQITHDNITYLFPEDNPDPYSNTPHIIHVNDTGNE